MVSKSKASSWSCLSFLKDALLLPTRNVKLFIPILLMTAVTTLLIEIHDVRTNERVNNTKSRSIDYAKLRQVLRAESGFIKITISAVITIAVVIFMSIVTIAFVYASFIQILPLFAASTTYSGDRYSLLGLFSKVILKGRHLRGPLITVVFVTIIEACKGYLLSLLSLPNLDLGTLRMAALSALPCLVFLYFDAVLLVAMAVSVADTKRRGVSALRQAWRLMTRVWWKEGLLLVVVHFFLEQVLSLSPLHRVAVEYWNKSMPVGLALLAVDALLSGLVDIFYFTAATVYYHQAIKSMKSMEVMAA